MVVNGIKKNGSKLGGKLIFKVQNTILQRNIRSSFEDLQRNKL